MKYLLGDYGQDQEQMQIVSVERLVSKHTPKTFIWHTVADETVLVENSLLFGMALRKNKIPFEMHLFSKGEHGLGVSQMEEHFGDQRVKNGNTGKWLDLFANWVEESL